MARHKLAFPFMYAKSSTGKRNSSRVPSYPGPAEGSTGPGSVHASKGPADTLGNLHGGVGHSFVQSRARSPGCAGPLQGPVSASLQRREQRSDAGGGPEGRPQSQLPPSGTCSGAESPSYVTQNT